MAPAPSLPPISSNATLHALTERLASHSRSLPPLIGSNFASSLTQHTLAAAASAYNRPAPPPSLPLLQLAGRHQEPGGSGLGSDRAKAAAKAGTGFEIAAGHTNGNGAVRCPVHRSWEESSSHSETRCARCGEEEMEGFVWDMGVVLRREFDCWVEQCWAEAFHHLFTHSVPSLLIHLILSGATPTFLRRSVVHGGSDLDNLFQLQMLEILFSELELRLAGARQPDPFSSTAVATAPNILPTAPTVPIPNPNAPPAPVVREGVCFQSLAYDHGVSLEDDNHALCLCDLTTCLGCFRTAAESRKGPLSPLPLELAGTSASMGWVGAIETSEQARIRAEGLRPLDVRKTAIPKGRGFVKNPKPAANGTARIPMLFPHPQMTDVLAVEEHLRWRLKEMGASDPAVEGRYGPSTNSAAALEGIDLPEEVESEDGTEASVPGGGGGIGGGGKKAAKVVKVTRGKGKVRRVVDGGATKKGGDGKKEDKSKICYLPKEWTDEDPVARNTAIVLSFRHFIKLLHQISTSVSPFAYPNYSHDIEELERVHPVALYRRLTEPVARRRGGKESRAWMECMDKWAEELGAREKTMGNKHVNEVRHASAVEYYTRAISLDPKKTVYFSNRAVALNALGLHERAEADCKHILSKDGKNGKAFYQRAVARGGMFRWREAEQDLREVLRYQPGNESAKKLIAFVKAEVGKLPKMSARDAMDF